MSKIDAIDLTKQQHENENNGNIMAIWQQQWQQQQQIWQTTNMANNKYIAFLAIKRFFYFLKIYNHGKNFQFQQQQPTITKKMEGFTNMW